MSIRIRNKIITEPLINILYRVRRELNNGKLHDIINKRNNICITCPSHKEGKEHKPSCYVFIDETDEKTIYGQVHCFTCGYTATFSQLITDLYDETDTSFGDDWLIENYGNTLVSSVEYLPEITLEKHKEEKTYLDESILNEYDWYHPYMWYRKLSKEVVDTFRVGYDKNRDAITFPVYDEKHRLVMVTARSVNSKRFWIPPNVEKPVYLLHHILENNIKTVCVVESQINCLYMWSLGYPCVGLFGTGSTTQLETLSRSGIRNFILCFDGDSPGRKGAYRFRKHMPKDCFITDVLLPAGKDVNDLSPEEVHSLIKNASY